MSRKEGSTKRFLLKGSPFANLLDRAEAERLAHDELAPTIDALSELVDYGTNLIPRCWGSSQRKLRDVVVIAILLKQVVTMLDASVELLKRCCVQPSFLPLRSGFEASVYMDWIMQARTDRRATAYYVWNIRRELKWARRVRKGTLEHRHLKGEFRKIQGVALPDSPDDEFDQRSVQDEIDRIAKHLRRPRFKAWNQRFIKLRGKRLYDPDWYRVLFRRPERTSFRVICRKVSRLAGYRLIYEAGSETMHSSRSDDHVRSGAGGSLEVIALRDPSNFGVVSQHLATLAFDTYVAVLTEYRPDESVRFARKWKTEWTPVLGRMVNVVRADH